MTEMIFAGLVPHVLKFCNSRDYTVEVTSGVYETNEVN
jgi:hypothetical protein